MSINLHLTPQITGLKRIRVVGAPRSCGSSERRVCCSMGKSRKQAWGSPKTGRGQRKWQGVGQCADGGFSNSRLCVVRKKSRRIQASEASPRRATRSLRQDGCRSAGEGQNGRAGVGQSGCQMMRASIEENVMFRNPCLMQIRRCGALGNTLLYSVSSISESGRRGAATTLLADALCALQYSCFILAFTRRSLPGISRRISANGGRY